MGQPRRLRRFAAILALAVLPWTVAFAGQFTLVFPLALVDPNTGSITSVLAYYGQYTTVLPPFLQAWGIGVVLYLGAVASALGGVALGREDRRVTAGLLVFAGLTQLSLAHGFSRQPSRFAIPLGTLFCLTVVLWFDWQVLANAVGSSE